MNNSDNKKTWDVIKIVSIVVLVIIILFNVLGTWLSISVMSNMPFWRDELNIENMPYTSDTPYIISEEPADPRGNIRLK